MKSVHKPDMGQKQSCRLIFLTLICCYLVQKLITNWELWSCLKKLSPGGWRPSLGWRP